MEKTLGDFLHPQADPAILLAALVGKLRSSRGDTISSVERLQLLLIILSSRPDLRSGLREVLLQLFSRRHAVLLFATGGIYPETGMFTETFRRFSHRLLPEADDNVQLKAILGRIFRRRDAEWLEQIPLDDWIAFIRALRFDETKDRSGIDNLTSNIFEALRVVAHRIAASGLEPEMLRLDSSLEEHESPFLMLCEEALLLASQAGKTTLQVIPDPSGGERHLLVLIDQALDAIERVHRRAQQHGASFHLTFHLHRLSQHLGRLAILANIVSATSRASNEEVLRHAAALWQQLAIAECHRNDLHNFWRENVKLMALRVTENAGKSGEHYISSTRGEYFTMLRSAMGGGIVIALMAANKIFLAKLGLAPLAEVLAFCLNYGIGFVLIHILHFAVATKQPAMTANAIASAIDEAQGKKGKNERNLEPLVTLIARTVRTQIAAILGNVAIAIPIAILFAMAIHWQTGHHFVDPAKAVKLLSEINPFTSGAIIFAAIAGVCLFLAGLISGYYDNLCVYNRIPQRLFQLDWPHRLFGTRRWRRIVDYIEDNLGALAGNFFFGFLLGGVSGLGLLLGLPLDIRHIAFSSAYWGYAMTGLQFGVDWRVALLAALGVMAIAITNLAVSFYLAMWVGIKARGVNFNQRKELGKALLRHLLHHPGEFFLPPKKSN